MKTDSFCVEQNSVEFHRGAVSVSATFDLALHTAAPKDDVQGSNEVQNAGYDRLVVMRDPDQWEVDHRIVRNKKTLQFPTITNGEARVTHLSIGISGKIRRVIELKEALVLTPNRRIEFYPGDIEIIDKE